MKGVREERGKKGGREGERKRKDKWRKKERNKVHIFRPAFFQRGVVH